MESLTVMTWWVLGIMILEADGCERARRSSCCVDMFSASRGARTWKAPCPAVCGHDERWRRWTSTSFLHFARALGLEIAFVEGVLIGCVWIIDEFVSVEGVVLKSVRVVLCGVERVECGWR